MDKAKAERAHEIMLKIEHCIRSREFYANSENSLRDALSRQQKEREKAEADIKSLEEELESL